MTIIELAQNSLPLITSEFVVPFASLVLIGVFIRVLAKMGI